MGPGGAAGLLLMLASAVGFVFKEEGNTTGKLFSKNDMHFQIDNSEQLPLHRGTTSCDRKSLFCEDTPPDYPKINVKKMLSSRFLQYNHTEKLYTENNVKPRLKDLSFCDYEEKVIFPKFAKNTQNKWSYVVQDGQEFMQGIRVEVCSKPDSECSHLTDIVGVRTTCKQHYVTRVLLAVTPEGKAEPESFAIPSCCKCYYSSRGTKK